MASAASLVLLIIRAALPLLALVFAGPAEASDAAARAALARGRAELLAARFERALELLAEGEREAEAPELLASLLVERGVIEATLDRHADALLSFSRALAFDAARALDPEESGDVAAEIFECARALVRAGVTDPRALAATRGPSFRCPRAPELSALPVTLAAPPEAEPFPIGAIGLATGGAALVAGAILGVVAYATRKDLDAGIREGRPVAELRAVEARGEGFAIAADVLAISGLVIGVVAWAGD